MIRFRNNAVAVQPVEHLEPLALIIGRWRTSGSVLDEIDQTWVAWMDMRFDSTDE
jgi:hypothetical protein